MAEQFQEAVSDEQVVDGLEEMDRIFDERFDFDPHPATREAWGKLLEEGIVRISRDDGPQGYRIEAEMDFLANMTGVEMFAGPYVTTYVVAEEIPHMDLPDHYIDHGENLMEAANHHNEITEEVSNEL